MVLPNFKEQNNSEKLKLAKQEAAKCNVNVAKTEILLKTIEQDLQRRISEKYKAILYLGTTGLYSAEDIAFWFKHNPINMNGDFNKNLGKYLKQYLNVEDSERVGITTIRRILFRTKEGFIEEPNNCILFDKMPPDLRSESSEDDDEQNT